MRLAALRLQQNNCQASGAFYLMPSNIYPVESSMCKSNKKHYCTLGFFVMLLFIGWIIYAADTGADNFFIYHVHAIPYGDKLGHIGLYGLLALLLNFTLGLKTISCLAWRLQLGSMLVLAFAVIEELSQGLFAARSLDAMDIVADIIGVYFAAIISVKINSISKYSHP